MAVANHCVTVGVFNSRNEAERAVSDLKDAGYRDDQIGIVAKNAQGKSVRTDGGGSNAEEGAAVGVAAGATVAALGSLAVTFGVIPVIGPVLAVGPLAAALISGAAGAAAGGVAGALIGWGIPEDEARYYEGEVTKGKYVVTVDADGPDRAREIYSRHGGYTRPVM